MAEHKLLDPSIPAYSRNQHHMFRSCDRMYHKFFLHSCSPRMNKSRKCIRVVYCLP